MLIKNPRMTYKDKKPITFKKFENNFWMLWAFSLWLTSFRSAFMIRFLLRYQIRLSGHLHG